MDGSLPHRAVAESLCARDAVSPIPPGDRSVTPPLHAAVVARMVAIAVTREFSDVQTDIERSSVRMTRANRPTLATLGT